jgi:propionyl-CoA carboxylase beta chain
VMGPDGAVNIIYRREIDKADDAKEARDKFALDYRTRFANPYKAAELGFVDEIIRPRMLRRRLGQALEMLKDKRQANPPKKHGNIPL